MIFLRRVYVNPPGTLTWGMTVVDLLSAVLILLSLQRGTVLYRVLTIRPLRWLGRISYGAYVFHDLPHMLYVRLAIWVGALIPFVGIHVRSSAALIALPCTLLLASLSFRYFESPFLRLKERLAPSMR